MIRRMIALVLTAVICLSLCACGGDSQETNQNPTQNNGNDGAGNQNHAPEVKEEKEFVLCREWKNVKSGHSVVIKEDGTYTSLGSTFSYTYNEQKQIVYLDSAPFSIIHEYGVYMLVFNEDEYLVSAENYEAVHAIFVRNGEKEIAENGTILDIGDAHRLMCGASFTLDKVELDKANTVFYVYLTCSNTADEGCGEFETVRGNWTSLYLGCPFDLTVEDGFVDRNTKGKEICLAFQTDRLTAEEIQAYSADSYGYFKLYFSAGKETFYIDIDQFFSEK